MDRAFFVQKLTNFYRYPSVCKYQDQIADHASYFSFLNEPNPFQRDLVLYIHVPFCRSLCNYCPFYKVHFDRWGYEGRREYADAVVRELAMYARFPFVRGVPVVNVNMGGGTPMVLEVELLERILASIHANFNMSQCEVVSIEGDPITLQDKNKLRALKASGLTRTSFGIQTFNERLRRKLNVESDVSDIYRAVKVLETVGIAEWGCDLLYNCPDQNINEVRYNVDRVCEIQPSVVDVYDLNILPNTSLHRLLERRNVFRTMPSNKNELALFETIIDTFEANDYRQVRSVNFEPKWYVHKKKSLLYVFAMDLIALGPSARTFLYSARRNYRNVCDVKEYVRDVTAGRMSVEAGNIVSEAELEERDAMLFPYFLEVPKKSINFERFKEKINELVEAGYVEDRAESIALTRKGKLWAGNVQHYLFGDKEKARMMRTTFLSIQDKKNIFNQDAVNCDASIDVGGNEAQSRNAQGVLDL